MQKSAEIAIAEQLRTAATLSEALPYMRRFSGKTFVVKFGGNAMVDDTLFHQFARDIVLLRQVGIHPIVVHGGGPQIGEMLARLNIESEFVDGLRVTDAATVEVVEMVLAGSINKRIAGAISHAGGCAIGICGKDGDLIVAKRLAHQSRRSSNNPAKVVDLGFVGEPVQVNTTILTRLIDGGMIPVVAPIAIGADGETYNVNADTAAGAVAGALHAAKLLMLTDVAGVLDTDGALINELSRAEAVTGIRQGTITGGMVPKVETCLRAVAAHTDAAHILDGRVPHVLLLEIFTEHGVGTMIVDG